MHAFKVSFNGQPPVVGGADDLGVLTAILTATGKLGPASCPVRPNETQDFSLRLGGLTARGSGQQDEHVTWLELEQLKVGDIVTIEIVETASPDPVVSAEAEEQREYDERAYFEHFKKGYMALRDKYEGSAGSS